MRFFLTLRIAFGGFSAGPYNSMMKTLVGIGVVAAFLLLVWSSFHSSPHDGSLSSSADVETAANYLATVLEEGWQLQHNSSASVEAYRRSEASLQNSPRAATVLPFLKALVDKSSLDEVRLSAAAAYLALSPGMKDSPRFFMTLPISYRSCSLLLSSRFTRAQVSELARYQMDRSGEFDSITLQVCGSLWMDNSENRNEVVAYFKNVLETGSSGRKNAALNAVANLAPRYSNTDFLPIVKWISQTLNAIHDRSDELFSPSTLLIALGHMATLGRSGETSVARYLRSSDAKLRSLALSTLVLIHPERPGLGELVAHDWESQSEDVRTTAAINARRMGKYAKLLLPRALERLEEKTIGHQEYLTVAALAMQLAEPGDRRSRGRIQRAVEGRVAGDQDESHKASLTAVLKEVDPEEKR